MMDRTDQRRLERQDARAVVRRTLGEQHHRIAAEQSPCDLFGRRAGLLPALAIDEHGALQFREPAEYRPSGYFAFGDEHHRRYRGDHADVEP